MQRALLIFVRLQILNFRSLGKCVIRCASRSVRWNVKDLDDVVLEDVLCHFQKIKILRPPKCL